MTVSSHNDGDGSLRIPIVEERLAIHKEEVETGRVRVSAAVETENVPVHELLSSTAVRVERIAVDRLVETPPETRTEGDRIIIPVIEEVLVKRIRIIEEVHLVIDRTTQVHDGEVELRRQTVTVERAAPEQVRAPQPAVGTDPETSKHN